MKKLVVHFVFVFLLCSLALVMPTIAAQNGKIAFESILDGNYEISIINPDGTDQSRLTNNAANDREPTWSPDGKKIAFTSDRDGNDEIYVMSSIGTSQNCITMSSASDSEPAWSPDGKKIAFTSNRDGNDEIYVMNADGTAQTRLTMNAASDSDPAWSPDGKKIAFTSYRDGISDCKSEIYVMNSDGTGQTRLTFSIYEINSCYGTDLHQTPAWSPDGTKIAFTYDLHGLGPSDISVMNNDGSEETLLFNTPPGRYHPSWSPDGTKIVYLEHDSSITIKVANSDGTGQTTLTDLGNDFYPYPSNPSWGPATDSITVISPNGGETWQRGTTQTVTWGYTSTNGLAVKIVLSKAGIEVGTIAASAPIGSNGKGSYTWPISSTGSTGGDYKVSVQSINQPTIKDLSDNYFTITPTGTTTPSIIVTSPNGGETWLLGSNHPVTWTSTGSVGSNVKIEALKAGVVVQTLSTSTPNNGTFSWTLPTGLATGSDNKIRITSTSNSAYTDSSNSNFTITTTTTTPSITVTSPNGGEVWYKYTTHAITWSYTGTPGSTVKIVLLKGGTQVSTIASSVSIGSNGKGSYSWFVPTTLVSGSDYSVSIQSVSQPTIKDASNANFKIYWA